MEQETNKHNLRCPVCGKYASEAMTKKYYNLVQQNKSLGNQVSVKNGHINALKKENSELKQSNGLVNKELENLRKQLKDLKNKNEQLEKTVSRLYNRGLFARIFNW